MSKTGYSDYCHIALVEHHIQDRVFGVTTDNATNNKTMVEAMQQALSSDVTDDAQLEFQGPHHLDSNQYGSHEVV
jgi:hypothetical protein